MGNRSRSELMLSFLLIAVLCLEAFIIKRNIYSPAKKMNWTEARQYCQKNHIDLVDWNIFNNSKLANSLVLKNIEQAWIGLLRDPEDDSVWRWIPPKNGERISEKVFSRSKSWADGEQSSHCAVVEDDLKWHSVRCSSRYYFYCSKKNTTKHHKNKYDWDKASEYCKDKNEQELATITITNTNQLEAVGWIGLYREAGETWKWIGDQQSNYRNWAQGEPLYADCCSFNPINKKVHSKACSGEFNFLCYDDNLVVVNENKTWEEALKHCRSMETPCETDSRPCTYHHDLLSLERLTDHNNYIRDRIDRATTDEVWTSLRFMGGKWWWANGQQLEEGMLPDCPSPWKHCGTLSKHDTNNWITRNCSEKRNFICYRYKRVSHG